ncbi:MAG: class I SAM-dependent methyltransferase [Solirubrobacteraceae bacterium]
MSASLVYRSARGYELVMLALYGRHYAGRMRAVADRVRPGASVLELCPGPGALYQRHLRARAGSYTAVDVNERFLARLRLLGARTIALDLSCGDESLPAADVVIMQASLYHFLPDARSIVERMLAAARERVIVSEPIRNLSTSRVPLVARVGRGGTDPGGAGDGHRQRFDERTLARLMDSYRRLWVESFKIPGGREQVYVLDPRLG